MGQKRTSEEYKTKEGETDPEAFDGLVRINQRARIWGRSHAIEKVFGSWQSSILRSQ
jgi:hypothetical protein